MSRTHRNQQIFTALIVATIAVSLLPARWVSWWTRDLSDIVNLPITPLAHGAGAIRGWLRPAPPAPGANEGERVRELVDEVDRFAQLYHAAEIRIRELEDHIDDLQQVPLEDLAVETRRERASIIGRDPISDDGLIELNRGSNRGVTQAAIGVYHSNQLVGRVVDVDRFRSWLRPITNPENGLIRAAIIPHDDPQKSLFDAVEVQLEPAGDHFTALVGQEHDVGEGDLVKLVDPRWPEAARARIIGIVREVRAHDAARLRNEIVVVPRFLARELASVTLIVELGDEEVGRGG